MPDQKPTLEYARPPKPKAERSSFADALWVSIGVIVASFFMTWLVVAVAVSLMLH